MKIINTIINLSISAVGLELVRRLLVTYNDPIIIGSLWIVLVCAKCCIEVICSVRKTN